MNDSFNSIRESILRHGKVAQGHKALLKHLDGERLSALQAIKARCYDCCAFYADGKVSCEMPDCALFPFMPFNPKKYKKEGRKISETQKNELRVRMQAMRKPKIKP